MLWARLCFGTLYICIRLCSYLLQLCKGILDHLCHALNRITCDENSLKRWNVVRTIPCIYIYTKRRNVTGTYKKCSSNTNFVTPVMFVKQVTTVYMYFLTFYFTPNASICECASFFTLEWKALKSQTLGTAVHVIVLVYWLEIDHCLVMFCSCPCKICSRVSDALSQALCNLSLAFLADFTLSDSTASIRFIVFSRKLHSAFCLDWKTRSQRSHVFRLTGSIPLLEAYLLPMANNQTCKNVSPKNKMTTSHMVQIHTHVLFPCPE